MLPTTALVGPATWYVGEGDGRAYADAARAVGATVRETGGLCRSRNAALEDARERGAICVQVSDDLRRCTRIEVREKPGEERLYAIVETTFVETVSALLAELAETPFMLAGCAPTANAYYFHPERRVRTAAFVVGDLIAVRPESPVRFDERLRLKEDYDFTLAHVREHGGVVRVDELAPQFVHRTNAGGAVAIRTAEREQEAIALLREKWGAVVRDNPRRPNEVLLDPAGLRRLAGAGARS